MKQNATRGVQPRPNLIHKSAFQCAHQRGVAVITALLLTTLAIIAVTDLFWQQQVYVRSIENQRLQLQRQWTLHSALDWVQLILSEDAKYSSTDTLDEPWAVPLTSARLDQYGDDEKADNDVNSAVLSGVIVDAQSRYNLTNLVAGGTINRDEVAVFERLLGNMRLDPTLAQATAEAMAATQRKHGVGAEAGDAARPMPLMHVADLLVVPGFTRDMVAKLREVVIVLPRPMPVNANTAPAEVLAARIAALSVADANALLAGRNTASFRDLADISHRLLGRMGNLSSNEISVASAYFLVNGKVRMGQVGMEVQALIERTGANTRVIWVREQ